MTTVTASFAIDRPVGEVFAYAADRRNRREMLPDNFTDFELGDGPTEGLGATFRFTIRSGRGDAASETTIVAFNPPTSFTEQTRTGDYSYQTRWSFLPDCDGAIVHLTVEYPAPAGILNRLLDRGVARRALRRSLMVELVRLAAAIEGKAR